MAAAQPEHNPLADLIAAHEERLGLLRIQAARKGDDAPAEITAEIARITNELDHLKQAATASLSAELVEDLGPVGRYQNLIGNIMRLDADIGRVRRAVELLDIRMDERFDALRTHIDQRLDTILLALPRSVEPLRPVRPVVRPSGKAGRR
jgi:hypothetical protein